MDANAYREIDRRLARLEKENDKLRSLIQGHDYGSVIGRHLAIPFLRGFWPMSSLNETPNVVDISGQGRTLTLTAATVPIYNEVVPYIDLNGTTAYLTRADEAGLEFTTALSFGVWVWFDDLSGNPMILTKWNTTGNQRAYALQALSTGAVRVAISSDGTLAPVFDTAAGLVTTGVWYHIVVVYTASNEISIYVDSVETSIVTSIPATIFSTGTAAFYIGTFNAAGGNFLNGRVTLCWISRAERTGITNQIVTELYQISAPYFK